MVSYDYLFLFVLYPSCCRHGALKWDKVTICKLEWIHGTKDGSFNSTRFYIVDDATTSRFQFCFPLSRKSWALLFLRIRAIPSH